MKYRICLFILFLLARGLYCSSQLYSVSLIPDSLKENSHCVIREFSRELTLKTVNSGAENIRKVITVLDKEGEDQAYLNISYTTNDMIIIKHIILYDGSGKSMGKVKLSEVYDGPAYINATLYSDYRHKYYGPDCAFYPFTIEYEYTKYLDNLLSYGLWLPVNDYNISIEKANLTVKYPNTITLRRKENNVKSNLTFNEREKLNVEVWELHNLKAIEEEPFDVSLLLRTQSVYLMPTELIYEKYAGKADTWEEYGAWIKSLYIGRDQLADVEKIRVAKLLEGVSDTLEQIKTLYKYLQDNTRYVAVFLGIGGFQPYDAKTVFETGYGECKALSNYMHALLKFAGLESFPALVSAGRNMIPVYSGFPNFNQFNHVILCVPFRKDTIWLECTSQRMPFGFLGDFTDDRDALLITDDGGKFARTTSYSAAENERICKAYISVDSAGTAICTINTSYKGLQYDDLSGFLYSEYPDQKDWLYRNSELPSAQISEFTVTENRNGKVPRADITQTVISRNYGSFTGPYLMLPLNKINSQKPVPKMLKPRRSDIFIDRPSVDYDTIVFQIPDNYIVDAIPSGNSINSVFGEYSNTVSLKDNEITFTRRCLINQGQFNPDEYKKFFDFVNAISKYDNVKVMLKKKQ